MTAVAFDEDVTNFPGLNDDQTRAFLGVCELMSTGELFVRIAHKFGLSRQTLYRYSESSEEARNFFARARLFQAHAVAEDGLSIADGTDELGLLYDELAEIHADAMEPDKRGQWLAAFHHGRVQRDKIRADSRKWYASKLAPKLYGEKLDITSNGETVKPGVVLLPAPDAQLQPPPDGMIIEQTTRVAVSTKGHDASARIADMMHDLKEGRAIGSKSNGNGHHANGSNGETPER